MWATWQLASSRGAHLPRSRGSVWGDLQEPARPGRALTSGQPVSRRPVSAQGRSRPARGFPTHHWGRCPHWRSRGRRTVWPGLCDPEPAAAHGDTYQVGCCKTSLPSKERMRVPGFSGASEPENKAPQLGNSSSSCGAGGGVVCSVSGHLRRSPGCQAPRTPRLPGVAPQAHSPAWAPGRSSSSGSEMRAEWSTRSGACGSPRRGASPTLQQGQPEGRFPARAGPGC